MQVVNHFSKASCITTKVGLCKTVRDLAWYETADHRDFYPRCVMAALNKCSQNPLTMQTMQYPLTMQTMQCPLTMQTMQCLD